MQTIWAKTTRKVYSQNNSNCIEKVYTNLRFWKPKKRLIFVEDNARAILKIGTSSKINDKYNIPGNKLFPPYLAQKICSQFDRKYNSNNFNHSSLIHHVIDRKVMIFCIVCARKNL